jgi:hypothetical protein
VRLLPVAAAARVGAGGGAGLASAAVTGTPGRLDLDPTVRHDLVAAHASMVEWAVLGCLVLGLVACAAIVSSNRGLLVAGAVVIGAEIGRRVASGWRFTDGGTAYASADGSVTSAQAVSWTISAPGAAIAGAAVLTGTAFLVRRLGRDRPPSDGVVHSEHGGR